MIIIKEAIIKNDNKVINIEKDPKITKKLTIK
jgi:hypothetical protein